MTYPKYRIFLLRYLGSALLLLASSIAATTAIGQDVLINEIQSSNGSILADEDGDFSDWVELHNAGSTAVDLAGWALSDRVDNPAKWVIASGSIGAGERLLIWASGKGRPGPGELHANFAISASGDESLVLSRPDGSVSDRVSPGVIPRDLSIGRYPDGAPNLGYFLSPTPGTANPSTSAEVLFVKPEFSYQSGFHDTPFDLQLSHVDPVVEIYYTLNGSTPDQTTGMRYTDPIRISSSTVVRAAAYRTGAVSIGAETSATYLFLEDVISRGHQPPAGYPTVWWSSVNAPHSSYGMSSVVRAYPEYAERMKEALLHVPSVSLVLPIPDLFGGSGIYSNPTRLVDEHGPQWEKQARMEWIDPNSGENFEVGVGLRMQGAGSRGEDSTPKKSFRVLFKSEYGPGRLDRPVFSAANSLVEDYNTLVFRAEYNNTWLHWAAEQREAPEFGLYLVDQWLKDRQIKINGIGSHGRKVQLFLNGIYWGLYTMAERPDAAFSASYLGGDREEYDAVGWRGIRDGDWDRWRTEIESVVSLNMADNANYLAVQQYLDVDHFIDYLVMQMFGGNQDWPRNNWTAIRHREDGRVYHITWDSERAMQRLEDDVVLKAGDPRRIVGDPPTFFRVLRDNAEFRLRFADRAHKHLFNGGALSPEVTIEDFAAAAEHLRIALFAEEARWGAYRKEIRERRSPSYYYGVESHWEPALERMLTEYLPARSGVLVEQLRATGFYPLIDAPVFSQHGGMMSAGSQLGISNPGNSGTVYYTLDGSDPRSFGSGEVSSSAITYSGAAQISGTVQVKARVLSGGSWSALTEAEFQTQPEQALFVPLFSGDWTNPLNWQGNTIPNGHGVQASINTPAATADRNISIYAPVTIGGIHFSHTNSPVRDRIRDRNLGNQLTFSNDAQPARIVVEGSGAGFAEFEVVAGIQLYSDLELDVRNPAGDLEHGALRLREGWFGQGGLIKLGAGRASLTGSDKHFTGPVIIREGALQITAPAAPVFAQSVSVEPGGQLRLISGSGAGDTRNYRFGGRLTIAGGGIDSGLPAGEQLGLLGALRYDPGTNGNHAKLMNAVQLVAASSVHVDGTRNVLELAGGLRGEFSLSKSGGGTLVIGGSRSNFTGQISVSTGTLQVARDLSSAIEVKDGGRLAGVGRVGPLSGSGDVDVSLGTLHAPSMNGLFAHLYMTGRGDTPEFVAPGWGSGLLRLDAAPVNPGTISIYINPIGEVEGERVFRGGMFVPVGADLAATISAASVLVFLPTPNGDGWQLAQQANVEVVPQSIFFGGFEAAGSTLQITIPELVFNYTTWREIYFPDPADFGDDSVSGPYATPLNDGITNLQRYALGVGLNFDPSPLLPRAYLDGDDVLVAFTKTTSTSDLRFVLRGSSDLINWNDVLYDSLTGEAEPLTPGWVGVRESIDSIATPSRFYRLDLTLQPTP